MSSMKTAKDLELSLLIKENKIQNLKMTIMFLQQRIDRAVEILEEKINFDSEQIGFIIEVVKILKGEDNEI